ncbi:MAG TPA: glycohydrolase toxin TNT-related protein, partial [Lentzea sp.]
ALGNPLGGGAPMGGPVGGAVGAVGGAVGSALGGVPSAAPAASAQVGAVVGQQPGQAPGQAAQQGQQAGKAADAKAAAEAKVGEARQGAQAGGGKSGVPGALSSAGQASAGVQASASGQQGQAPGQPGQAQSGNQAPGQAQAGGKDALAKDPSKDALKDALLKDPNLGDLVTDGSGTQKVGDTIAAPTAPGSGVDFGTGTPFQGAVTAAPGTDQGVGHPGGVHSTGETVTSAPLAGVDLSGGHQSGSLTDRLDNREHNQALSGVPGVAFDVARHTYTAAAAGSWFMAIFLSTGKAPRLAPKPARQLPAPKHQPDQQPIPRFAPQDHPQADLVVASAGRPEDPTASDPSTTSDLPEAHSDGLGKDHPTVQALLTGYDALAGMHERDWSALFEDEDGTPRWPVEREGGYEDSQPEILKAGAELDRFGSEEGRVLAKAGTPFAHRSLPPQAADEGYRRYRVNHDLPVHRTISAPWFGQPGGGSRYRTTYPVADLVALGYLTEITA